MMHGGITEQSVGGWDNWGTLRKYNILLGELSIRQKDHLRSSITILELTRLMRAQWYYEMIKRFNEVPGIPLHLKIRVQIFFTKGKTVVS